MKKKLLIALCSILAVAAIVTGSVLGTIAYQTSSAAVSNVFTVGNIQIVMDETKVNPDGTIDTTTTKRVDTNTYHLVPSTKYLKDPQIRVNEGSENSFLFVLVRNDLVNIGPKGNTPYLTIDEQMEYLGWREYTTASTGKVYIYCGGENGNTDLALPEAGSAEFDEILAKRNAVAGATEWVKPTLTQQGKAYDLFKYFYTDPSNTDLNTYGAAKITLTALAIQASGFDLGGTVELGSKESVDAAWKNLMETYDYIHTDSN